jgi:hypothetical protein
MDMMLDVCQSKALALHDFLLVPHYCLAHWLEKFSLLSQKNIQ